MVGPAHHTRLVIDRGKFSPRAVLRQNLRALMALSQDLKSQSALHKKTGVAQSTIGRILSEHGENAGIETIERLAKAFELQGWQLLVAGMDPRNPPVLQPLSPQERQLYDRLRGIAQDIGKYGPSSN